MRFRIPTVLCAAATALVAGCNAVYFYETDKISLTVEARPDSTGPIQGNLGVKQRVVAFVPESNRTDVMSPHSAKEADATSESAARARGQAISDLQELLADSSTTKPAAAGDPVAQQKIARQMFVTSQAVTGRSDAMSVLSAMRFHKLPKPEGAPWYKVSHVIIDSSLITGSAAKLVAHPGESIGALSGQPGRARRLVEFSAWESVYGSLSNIITDDARAAEAVRNLDALANRLPAAYPVDVYRWDQAHSDLQVFKAKGAPVDRSSFRSVTSYGGQLNDSLRAMSNALGSGRAFTVSGTALDDLGMEGLRMRLTETLEARDEFEQTVTASPAIREAVKIFSERF